jgi:hypothetical protein
MCMNKSERPRSHHGAESFATEKVNPVEDQHAKRLEDQPCLHKLNTEELIDNSVILSSS